MPRFRNVNAGRAGPRAVGILVPPGSRTLVVVRPRALPVDLVMVRMRPGNGHGSGFMEATRQEAGIEAQKLGQSLLNWAEGGPGRLEVVPAADGPGYWLYLQVETFSLVACSRISGQPYRPMSYATQEEAERIAEELRTILCPQPEANQELYTNLSQFGR